jgi:hypothetical protein
MNVLTISKEIYPDAGFFAATGCDIHAEPQPQHRQVPCTKNDIRAHGEPGYHFAKSVLGNGALSLRRPRHHRFGGRAIDAGYIGQ